MSSVIDYGDFRIVILRSQIGSDFSTDGSMMVFINAKYLSIDYCNEK